MPVGTFGIFGRKVEKMVYHALLNDKIACEQNGTDFFCPSEDRRLLRKSIRLLYPAQEELLKNTFLILLPKVLNVT